MSDGIELPVPGENPEEPRAERDAAGRFLPGNRTSQLGAEKGGRPRGVDLLSLVRRERADTLEAKLLAAFDGLCARAAKGDPQAAKLLFDRICEMQALDVNVSDGRNLVTMPEDERAARVLALLNLAKERFEAAEAAKQEPGGTGNTGNV